MLERRNRGGRGDRRRASRAVAEAMEPRRLLSAAVANVPPAVLAADVNTVTGNASPTQFTPFGSGVLFVANDGVNGPEIWKTDGTAANTVRVSSLPTISGDVPGITLLPAISSNVELFWATDSAHGRELWRTDGTEAGTFLLKDINPGTASSPRPPNPAAAQPPDRALVMDGVLYFQASDGAHGYELWRSDGTEAGTYMVKDLWAGSSSGGADSQVVINDVLYFRGADGTSSSVHLFRSDGTAAGTDAVDAAAGSLTIPYSGTLAAVGSTLYYVAPGTTTGTYRLAKTDGTTATAVASVDAQPAKLTAVGDRLFFTVNDSTTGTELWTSNGTAAGTVLVKDIYAGATSSSPTNLTAVGSKLFFAALDATHGTELWVSDGTAGGTTLVKDIQPGTSAGFGSSYTAFNGLLYFSANDTVNGPELWRSDGTDAGTYMVVDARPGVDGVSPSNMAAIGGTLYFQGSDGVHGAEPWTSDGTAGATGMLLDLNATRTSGSSPSNITPADGFVYFAASDNTGSELWRSDGTPEGAFQLADIMPGGKGSNPASLTYVGGTLYFFANDPTHGRELWKSDGTAAGTVMVKDINPGTASGVGTFMIAMGGSVYFAGTDATHGQELWKSDGTDAGTVMVADSAAGTDSSNFYDPVVYHGALYFGRRRSSSGSFNQIDTGLWRSDGTAAGTVQVSSAAAVATELCVAGDTLFFQAWSSAYGYELWMTDGTVTQQLYDINPGTASSQPIGLTAVGNRVCFWANDGRSTSYLWTSDGTGPGTQLVQNLAGGANSPFTAGGGFLYFGGSDGSGMKLWRTDGTSAGTQLVTNMSGQVQMGFADGLLYFSGTDSAHGSEPWVTDGTPAGTRLVSDVMPGTGYSQPTNFTALGDTMYFTATDGSIGRELWRIGPPAHATARDAGGGTIVIEGTAGADAVDVTTSGGNVVVTLPGTAGTRTFPAAGVTQIVFDGYGGGDSLTVRGGAAVTLARAADLSSLTLDSGTLKLAGGGSLGLSSLSIASGGALDVGTSAVVIRNGDAGSWTGSTYSGVAGLVAAGRGSSAGADRITSSAATPNYTVVGLARAGDVLDFSSSATTTWRGQTVAAGDVLLLYTYAGDANLDGVINIDDYTQIDSSVAAGGALKGFFNGDFNLDGNVDIDDYTIIDSNIGVQGPPL